MPLSDTLGHDREIGILRKAISNKRIAHSFLFVGPHGIGKRFTAVSLAKALNCSALSDDFCGECQNCRDIDNSSYGDVFIIEPREPESKGGEVDHETGIIKIDAVRDVQQRLSYRAVRGGKKICIVDGAEKMNKEAQNAFLKTLEEPPPDSVIILIVSDGTVLLPTIISRCQRINFRPLPRNIMVGIVRKKIELTHKERLAVNDETAALLSSLSGGSVGKALGWDIESMLEQRKKIVEMLPRLSLTDMEGLFKAAEEISKGDRPVESLEFLKMWYRDMAVVKQGGEDMIINSDILPVLKQHAGGKTFDRLANGFKLIHQAQMDIMPPQYANKQLTVENLLMQLAYNR
ncbi:MAG: DNA polymerase III subunit delta' [Deltaproteobacteria bacterium]|nr:DNA polymerase III subunit delta' [Deltaproteobacteria bacterium]